MQQDPPPSRAPREPIPWAAAPASSCAWPSQGGTSVPEPWPKPGPGHGNPTGPTPGARTGHAQTGAATSGGRVKGIPGPCAYGCVPICPLHKVDHCIRVCIGVCIGMQRVCIGYASGMHQDTHKVINLYAKRLKLSKGHLGALPYVVTVMGCSDHRL